MFKPGDKVQCIKENEVNTEYSKLTKGHIYTVLEAGYCNKMREYMVILREKQRRDNDVLSRLSSKGYFASRFTLYENGELEEKDYYQWLANRLV